MDVRRYLRTLAAEDLRAKLLRWYIAVLKREHHPTSFDEAVEKLGGYDSVVVERPDGTLGTVTTLSPARSAAASQLLDSVAVHCRDFVGGLVDARLDAHIAKLATRWPRYREAFGRAAEDERWWPLVRGLSRSTRVLQRLALAAGMSESERDALAYLFVRDRMRDIVRDLPQERVRDEDDVYDGGLEVGVDRAYAGAAGRVACEAVASQWEAMMEALGA